MSRKNAENIAAKPEKKRKKERRWRIVTASGEQIKHRYTMRFWFSVTVFFLFLTTCLFTAGIFYIIQ